LRPLTLIARPVFGGGTAAAFCGIGLAGAFTAL
jgi:hypothetical protein